MLSGKKSLMSMVLALLLLCGIALAEESASGATALTNADYQQIVSTYSIDASIPGYADYLERYEDAAHPDVTVTVDAETFVRYEDAGIAAQPQVFEDYEGMAGKSVLTGEESLTEWVVDVPESGLYDLTLLYYPYAGKNSAIQRAFFIDGKLPYSELAMVDFNRVWVNGTYEEYADENGIVVRKWDKDNQGNDLKPSPIEQPEWCTRGLYDTNGYISDEMSIYLEAGQHTLTLLSMREPMLLRSITLSNHARPASYADVKAANDAAGHQDATGVSVRFEAENAVKTSSQMLYPVQDQSSAVVYPMSARYLLNNSIGSSWKNAGQWIEWSFTVPQDGYYEISMALLLHADVAAGNAFRRGWQRLPRVSDRGRARPAHGSCAGRYGRHYRTGAGLRAAAEQHLPSGHLHHGRFARPVPRLSADGVPAEAGRRTARGSGGFGRCYCRAGKDGGQQLGQADRPAHDDRPARRAD